MIYQEPSSQNNIEEMPRVIREPQPQPLFVSINYQNKLYRIPNQQYHLVESMAIYITSILGLFALSSVALIVFRQMGAQIPGFIITCAVGYIPINIYIIRKGNIKDRLFQSAIIALNIFLVVLSIFIALKISVKGPLSFFFAAIIFVLSRWSVQNRSKIVIIFLMVVEIGIIGLKIDEMASISWMATLLGLVIMFSFLAIITVFMLLYMLFFMALCCSQPNYKIKMAQLVFHVAVFSSISCLVFMPIWSFLFQKDYEVMAFIYIVISIATVLFFNLKKSLILLSLFQNPQVVRTKDIKLTVTESTKSKIKNLYKISETWLIETYDKESCGKQLNDFECLVCMNDISDVVWMPCGHCNLCTKCALDVMNKNIIQCTICKQKPQFLAKIVKSSPLDDEIHFKNEFKVQSSYTLAYK